MALCKVFGFFFRDTFSKCSHTCSSQATNVKSRGVPDLIFWPDSGYPKAGSGYPADLPDIQRPDPDIRLDWPDIQQN